MNRSLAFDRKRVEASDEAAVDPLIYENVNPASTRKLDIEVCRILALAKQAIAAASDALSSLVDDCLLQAPTREIAC